MLDSKKNRGILILFIIFIWAAALELGLLCLEPVFAKTNFKITAISFGENPVAVIDGLLVGEGDEIHGIEIMKIGEKFVKFKFDDEIITEYIGRQESSQRLKTDLGKNKPLNQSYRSAFLFGFDALRSAGFESLFFENEINDIGSEFDVNNDGFIDSQEAKILKETLR